MRARSLLMCLALTAGTASTAVAQYPSGDSGPGASPGAMHRRHGMEGGRSAMGMTSLDPVVAEGPPAPSEFSKITSLPDTQRYARLYNGLMSSTRPQRDSLTAARTAMRNAFQDGNREAGRSEGSRIKSLADALAKRQETFDSAVKDMVSKEEWKKYQDWRAQRRKEAKDDHHANIGPRRAGGSPPDVVPDAQQ